MNSLQTYTDPVDVFAKIDHNAADLDFSDALGSVSDVLCQAHSRYFDAETSPDGIPWAPLSPRTIEQKFHRGLGGGNARAGRKKAAAAAAGGFGPDLFNTILIDTGAMKSSVSFRGNQDHLETIAPLSIDWGTKDPKAGFHQDGTKNMPARPFVGWSQVPIDTSVEIVADAAVTMLLVGI